MATRSFAGPSPNTGHVEEFWKTAAPVREIIRKATRAAGIPYFCPHSIRSTLARKFLLQARPPEERKAVSQNLGHENEATTMEHYATLSDDLQREVMLALWQRGETSAQDMELVDLINQVPSESRHVLKATAQALIKR
ncbi:hypothetical protein ABWH98_26700 [Labrenzia sp. ac12]